MIPVINVHLPSRLSLIYGHHIVFTNLRQTENLSINFHCLCLLTFLFHNNKDINNNVESKWNEMNCVKTQTHSQRNRKVGMNTNEFVSE